MSKSRPVLASLCLALGLLLAPTTGVADAAAPTAGTTTDRAASSTVDDRKLVRSDGWRSVTAAQAYRKTLSKSTKKGSTATTKGAAASGASVTFQFGPRRGKAEILVGGKVRKTVSTAAAKVRFGAVRVSGAGKVQVRVLAGGRGVFLDKVVLGLDGAASPFATGPISQVDASAAGAGGNGHSVNSAAVSPDGQFVAFWSDATNLSPEATDGLMHLYVKTLATGAVRVADTSASGVLGNDGGYVGEARVVGWRPVGHRCSSPRTPTTCSTARRSTAPTPRS